MINIQCPFTGISPESEDFSQMTPCSALEALSLDSVARLPRFRNTQVRLRRAKIIAERREHMDRL